MINQRRGNVFNLDFKSEIVEALCILLFSKLKNLATSFASPEHPSPHCPLSKSMFESLTQITI